MSLYRLSRQENADLDEITNYIATDNPEAAIAVLDKLLETFFALAESPQMGTGRDDLKQGLRVFSPNRPAHHYVIFYYPIRGGIEISDVIHGARDWIGMFAHGDR